MEILPLKYYIECLLTKKEQGLQTRPPALAAAAAAALPEKLRARAPDCVSERAGQAAQAQRPVKCARALSNHLLMLILLTLLRPPRLRGWPQLAKTLHTSR